MGSERTADFSQNINPGLLKQEAGFIKLTAMFVLCLLSCIS